MFCNNYPFLSQKVTTTLIHTKLNVISPKTFLFVFVQQVGASLFPSHYYIAQSQSLCFHVDVSVLKYNPHAFIFSSNSLHTISGYIFLPYIFGIKWYNTLKISASSKHIVDSYLKNCVHFLQVTNSFWFTFMYLKII